MPKEDENNNITKTDGHNVVGLKPSLTLQLIAYVLVVEIITAPSNVRCIMIAWECICHIRQREFGVCRVGMATRTSRMRFTILQIGPTDCQ